MSDETLTKHLKKRRPSAKKVFFNVFVVILSILAFRWLCFEMFLIPSGSMYPHLFIKDYLVATKLDFGLRLPFSQKWVIGPHTPKRGEVVIFKSLDDSKFFIKRVIGLPGDSIKISGDFVKSINGKPSLLTRLSDEAHQHLANDMGFGVSDFVPYGENISGVDQTNIILTSSFADLENGELRDYNVPPGHLLVMGDNRHRSMDGRMFGYLPLENLIGKARRIVFSCGKYNPGTTSCDLKTIRFDRLGNKIGN